MAELQINANDGRIEHLATGGETTFAFDFPLFKAEHLSVYRQKAGADEGQSLTLNTDYTVTGVNVQPGSGTTEITLSAVLYPSGADEGDLFVLELSVPEERNSDFLDAGDFFADTINTELDLLTQQTQQLRRDVGKALTFPKTSTVKNRNVAEPEAGKLLGWDETGTDVINYNSDTASAEAAALAAETARDLAQAWAANPQNTVVSGGLYSALNYAISALGASITASAAADDAANSAQAAGVAALTSATLYANTTDGLAGTSDGDYFYVIDANTNQLLALYLNDSGTAVAQGTGLVANANYINFLEGDYRHILGSTDPRGRIISGVRPDGAIDAPLFSIVIDPQREDFIISDTRGRYFSISGGSAVISSFFEQSTTEKEITELALTDPRGRFIGEIGRKDITVGGLSIGFESERDDISFVESRGRRIGLLATIARIDALEANDLSATSFNAAEIAGYDAQALNASLALISNGNNSLEGFLAGYRHVVEYGQSFSIGALAHPARTGSQLFDALMLGDSVRPANLAATFAPYGGVSELNALAATVEGPGSTLDILDSGEIAALDWEDAARGETASLGFSDYAKYLFNQKSAVENDTTRRLIVTSSGHGGQNVSQLSKDAPGNAAWFFARTVDAASQIKSIADTDTVASGVAAYLWQQGQADVTDGTAKATYKTAVKQLRDDLHTDIQVGEYGRTKRAAFLFTQTSGADWTLDSTDLAVPIGQLEMSQEEADMFLACPEYPMTNKPDGHPDANGNRWRGMQLAKVYHRVVNLRQGWQPLHITKAIARRNQILLQYHVPAPPLQFRDYYEGFTAVNHTNKGFEVEDETGTNTITAVEIAGDATVLLTLGRDVDGTATVTYGGETVHGGGGNVADSDAAVPPRNYEYLSAAGDDASVNVAALVDKPYPLNNFACLQKITTVAG